MPKCLNCGEPFSKKYVLHKYCSPECRYQYSLKTRQQKVRAVLVDKETHHKLKVRAITQQKSMGEIIKELLTGK